MNVKTVDYHSSDASADLAESLRNTGFAVLVNHPITPQRIEDIYSSWAAFFSDASKHDWLRDPVKQDGFFPFKSEHAKGSPAKDLKEFYHVYPWGRVPPQLEDITRSLYQDLNLLGIELLGWLDDALPDHLKQSLSLPLAGMMQDSQQSLLRILHYPALAETPEPDAIRAAAHEDINLITLLLAGSKPGLEAMDTEGQWHSVPCDPGMITINNGDMLALATDGYYPSTTHRVINPDQDANEPRFSMPMFLHPKPDVDLKPGFTADDFLQQRLREIGLK
jgi:isopenicillin N synthase-like dioxygenase